MVFCFIWFSVPSVLFQCCWLGHLTRKNPSPYDLYCVGGTLSLTQSINLSVCFLTTSCKSYWLDLHENFTTDVSLDKEELAKFWRSFASRSGSKKHSCSSTLWDRACFHNSAQDSGSGPNLLCDRLSWFNPLLNCTLNPCTSLYFPFGRGVYCPSALVWTCCAHPNSFDVDTVYLLLYVTTVSV